MKRPFLLGTLAIAFAACNPDIPQTAASQYVTALFDPANSIVPTPNSLATDPTTGLLKVPIASNASPAQAEFTTDFLNTLDGYPRDTPARATFDGALVPTSVNAGSVRVLDLANGGTPVAGAAPTYVASANQILIPPPSGSWPNGHTIAVVLIASSSGLQSAQGVPIIASATWSLVRGKTPLVTCTVPDASSYPDCQPTVSIIPSNEHDPLARIQDQTRTALQLEMIRKGFAPLLDSFESQGVPRENIPLAWTFKITVRPDVTFDPANNVVPFPNDVLLDRFPDGGTRVKLPLPDAGTLPDGGVPDIVQLYMGLNTLDGFSTTTPAVSVFNADNLGALNQGKIDAGSLGVAGATGILRLGGNAAHAATVPSIAACLDCASSLLPDGGTPDHPQRLQFVPNVPLDEKTQYGVFITTTVTDNQGHKVIPSSAFALIRLANPLYDGTKSTVDLITDAQAQQLEPLRAALKPFIDAVAANVGGRSNIALAWAFTTQSEVSTLKQLRLIPQGLPASPLFIEDKTSVLRPFCPTPGNCPNVSHFIIGEIDVAVLLSPAGPFNPSGMPMIAKIPFLLTLPNGAMGAYPVVVFGHGLTRARTDLLPIVDRLAQGGQAAIATDVVWHGDRTTCTGSHVVLPPGAPDDAACANPVTQMCAPSGRCIARDRSTAAPCSFGSATADQTCIDTAQGFCYSDGKCENGDYLRDSTLVPRISGWNILNLANQFATRDNFRQQVIDLTQLTRVIAGSGTGSLNDLLTGVAGGRTLDPTRINYAGQSLGGILGTLYSSVATEVHRTVLNVPGADLAEILLTSNEPGLVGARMVFLATLANEGITQGTIGFDTFIGIAKWILDPADPQNMAFSLLNGTDLPGDRKALVQYIADDQVVPNPTTIELINGANRVGVTPVDVSFFNLLPTDPPPLGSRHGFLLNFADPTLTATAQCQVTNYVNTGAIGTCP
jgi:hypothetical protein